MSVVDAARQVLITGVAGQIFPAAVANVGSSSGVSWQEAFGRLTFAADAVPATVATPFDLASLTKVIATTAVIMDLVASGMIRLDDLVATHLPEWRGPDRESVTVQDLLEHASGLPARLLDKAPATVREYEHDICVMPLEYAPRTRSIYSDLGFILLGMVVTRLGGRSLAADFDTLRDRLAHDEPALASEPMSFELRGEEKKRAAPTSPLDEDARRGSILVGEVHDNYAATLGAVAGHSGLFGTAAAVASFARIVLRALRGDRTLSEPMSPSRLRTFARKTLVPGSSRALGWDTMLKTSSCGSRLSPTAIGHVGFTGTSLWIDPIRDRYFVLLTNRAFQGGSVNEMQTIRRAFHDALGGL